MIPHPSNTNSNTIILVILEYYDFSTSTFRLQYDQQTLTFIRALKNLGHSSIRHRCPSWHVDVNAALAERSLIRGSFCLGCYRADAAAQPDAPASNHPPILSRVSNFGSAGKECEGRHFVPPLPSPPLQGGWHLAGSDSERRKDRHTAEGSAAAFWLSELYASLLPPFYSLPAASYIFMVVTATDSISPAMCSSAHANNSYRSLLSNPTNFTAPWQNSREGQLQRSINKKHENL